jgi:DNA-binding MarR family transcriptional regulator
MNLTLSETYLPMWLSQGKEGKNNWRIIELLAEHEEPMIVYEIRERLGIDRKRNSTILYRVQKLEEAGILEKVGEIEASKTHEMSDLFQLSTIGLVEAALSLQEGRARKRAIERCRRKIVGPWKTFTQLYELDKVRTGWPAYQSFVAWLESDEGILHFIGTFGVWPFAGEAAALYTFRRMIDLALLRRHRAWLTALPAFGVGYQQEWLHGKPLESEWVQSVDHDNPYMALGEIAVNHEKFRKLDTTLGEVDAPIYDYFDKLARDEVVQQLSVPLGETDAKELAVTPFFIDQAASRAGVSSRTHNLLSPDSLFNLGAAINIERKRVVIRTDDPDRINPKWKELCDLEVIDALTMKVEKIPAKRASE